MSSAQDGHGQGQVALATGEVLGPLSVREVPSTIFVRARELLDSPR